MMLALATRTRSARILAKSSGLDDVFHHMAVHIGEAEIATLVLVGELLMINTELVEQRGMEVVNVHGFLTKKSSCIYMTVARAKKTTTSP